MSSTFASLNLRPQERRLVVFVAIVVFAVVNVVWVWPHFGDWSKKQVQRDRAKRTLATYQAEIAKVAGYQVKLRELKSAGPSVLPGEQDLDLVRIVNEESRRNRLNVTRADPRPRVSATQTNRFFEEEYVTIHVNTGSEELVNFLVSLTSTNSLIRVKDLNLKPEPSGYRLDGDIVLVASYQRSTPAKAPAAIPSSASSGPAASKTAATGASKPSSASTGAAKSNLTTKAAPPRTVPSRPKPGEGTAKK